MPGFPPSLSRTLTDLRLSASSPESLAKAGESGADLARLYAAASAQFEAGGAADRAALFATAVEALADGRAFCRGCPIVLLDVAIDTAVEERFVRALLAQSSGWLALVPAGDDRVRRRRSTGTPGLKARRHDDDALTRSAGASAPAEDARRPR